MCHEETLVELRSRKAVSQIVTKHSPSYEKSKVNVLAFLLSYSYFWFSFVLFVSLFEI